MAYEEEKQKIIDFFKNSKGKTKFYLSETLY